MNAQQIDEYVARDKLFADAYGDAWRAIRNAEFWQSPDYRFLQLAPDCVPDWQWSATFNKWGAVVVLSNGWTGYTYPRPPVTPNPYPRRKT